MQESSVFNLRQFAAIEAQLFGNTDRHVGHAARMTAGPLVAKVDCRGQRLQRRAVKLAQIPERVA